MATRFKPKKGCCKSNPRCKRCPVVAKRLVVRGLADAPQDGLVVISPDATKKQLKAARARQLTRCAVAYGRDGHLSRHRWRGVPRLASVRRAAAPRPSRHLRRQPRDRLAEEHRAHPRRRSSASSCSTSSQPYFVDEPIDFVYHLASPASPIDYLRLPLHTLKVGSHGTHHTLGLAKKHRARFLLASTSEVYGDPQVHPQPETYWGHVNPIGPRGVYDEAKRYAEALTMAYHRQQGVDTAIIRIFNTYGPRMRPHDGRAIPTFLRQALQDRPITVFGDGSQTRSFCYVDDLIRGMIALAESGQHEPDQHRQPERVHAAASSPRRSSRSPARRRRSSTRRCPTDDPQVRQPDIALARELLGWEPEVELRDGLLRTIDQSGTDALVGAGGS